MLMINYSSMSLYSENKRRKPESCFKEGIRDHLHICPDARKWRGDATTWQRALLPWVCVLEVEWFILHLIQVSCMSPSRLSEGGWSAAGTRWGDVVSTWTVLFVPRRPPPKAFGDFKLSRGYKINCVLQENKARLLEHHSLLQQLTDEVNAVKSEINGTTAATQQRRETQGSSKWQVHAFKVWNITN